MDGNTNGAGATMHTFISYFPFVWSCVRGSSSYFLTLFDPVIFVPCPWPYCCLTESHRVRFPALSFPESPRRNPDFDDNPRPTHDHLDNQAENQVIPRLKDMFNISHR